MICIHRRSHRFHQEIYRKNNDLFSIKIYTYSVYIHTRVCVMCVCVPKYKLLSLDNVTLCVFSGMSIWYWISNWCALPPPSIPFYL